MSAVGIPSQLYQAKKFSLARTVPLACDMLHGSNGCMLHVVRPVFVMGPKLFRGLARGTDGSAFGSATPGAIVAAHGKHVEP